jgi:hypothetical protein
MPRRFPTPVPHRPAPPPGLHGLTDDQVSRWADLIADGRDDLPDGLPAQDRERLAEAVRRRLRDRMLRLIARAIAARLRRDGRPGGEVI